MFTCEEPHLARQFSQFTCIRLCDPMDCSMPGFPVNHQLQSLLKLMSIESVMPSNNLILCHSLLCLPSICPSIRVFSNESVCRIRWPKYCSFNFNISLLKDGLVGSLAVQEILKSLLQHHSSKVSVLRHSTLTSIHEYWKNHSLD